MNTRLYNWKSRFVNMIATIDKLPLVWGEWDCMAFSGACVEAVMGENPYTQHKGKYDSPETAMTYLSSIGHNSLDSLLSSMYEPCHQSQAWQGDLAIGIVDGITAGCVIIGERVGVLTTTGYGTMARSNIINAYKVGH